MDYTFTLVYDFKLIDRNDMSKEKTTIFVMKRRSGVEYDIPVIVLNYIETPRREQD